MKFTSPVWSGVSGSVGGTTYGRGPFGGLVARARATPSNPNTSPQQAVRAALGAASAGWAALSASARQEWEDYAAATPLTGPLGESITVGGLQMYQRWASLRHLVGEAITQPSPIATSGLGNPCDSLAAESMTNTITVGCSAGASDDGNVVAFISPPLSAGQTSIHRPLVLSGESDIASAATSATVTPTGAALVTANRHVIRARLVYDDGRVSQAFTEVVTVAAS